MAEFGRVQVWLGYFQSEAQLDAYFAEHYSEDGRQPLNRFVAEQGQRWLDHDFCERGWADAPDVRQLVAPHSFASSYVSEVVGAWRELGYAWVPNTVVLVWNEEIGAPRTVEGSDYMLVAAGTFECRDERPQPAAPEPTVHAHRGRVTAAAFLPDGGAVTGARYGEVFFWQPDGTRVVGKASDGQSDYDWVHGLAVDGAVVYTGSSALIAWSADAVGRTVLAERSGSWVDVQLSQTALYALGAVLVAIDRGTDTVLSEWKTPARPTALCVDEDQVAVGMEDLLVVRRGDETVLRIDTEGSPRWIGRWASGWVWLTWKGELGWVDEAGEIFRVSQTRGVSAVLHRGHLVIGHSTGEVSVWTDASGPRHRWRAHRDRIYALAASEAGVVTGSRDGSVALWGIDGEPIRRWETGPADRPAVEEWLEDPYEVYTVAISPQGRVLAGEASGRVHFLS